MSKPSRLTPLPKTPALVRRTASIAAVATAVGVVGCTQHVPPQVPDQRDEQPPQVVAPQVAPPQDPPPPQMDPLQADAPQVDGRQIAAPQLAPPPGPPPQIPRRPIDSLVPTKK